jgi:predicted AAA+ superfamily ATPase
LLPVLAEELAAFGMTDLDRRLLRGGLPGTLLADEEDPVAYREWLDSYFARDIQELFRVDKRGAFLRLLETLLRQSGGLLEVTSLSRACDLSRPTTMTYLDVLEVTHAIHVLRPYHGGGSQELVRQPKVYAFDTGFVAHARGWRDLRAEDRGQLWEHLVLDTLLSIPAQPRVHFWRDKQQHEVDFVIPGGRGAGDAVECKWKEKQFDPRGLRAFRAIHARGRNFVVTPAAEGSAYSRTIDRIEVRFVGPADLRREIGT